VRFGAGAGVTIRPAFPDDSVAVARLAALDSSRVPSGSLLLAEIAGEPWAAIALHSGRVIADPFRPTAGLVELLRGRAGQLVAARPRPTPRWVPRRSRAGGLRAAGVRRGW
jgi:hypothetical protein